MIKPETAYRPQLDGLRAICILFTVCHHTPGMPSWINGSIGVDIFFALSGWLITWLLMTERVTVGRINLGAFYIRRLFRIVPLYLVTIGLYVVAALGMRVLGQSDDWQQLQQAIPYLVTFTSEYRSDAAGNIFGHAWTLGIEEKFYLIWPAALVLASRHLWIAFAVSLAASFCFVLLGDGSAYIVRGYCGIAFGAGLAMLTHRSDALTGGLRKPSTAYLSTAVIVVAYVQSLAAPHEFAWNVVVSLFGSALVANLWFNRSTLIARALAVRPMEFAGKLTYGMYLVHVLCLNVVALVLAKSGLGANTVAILALGYVATFVAAYVLHRSIERPLISVGRQLAQNRQRAVQPAA